MTVERRKFKGKIMWIRGKKSSEKKLEKLIKYTRYILIFERIWLRMWPIIILFLLFASIALIDILPKTPFLIHILVLLGFVSCAIITIQKLFKANYDVSLSDIRKRLSNNTGFSHHELSIIDDENVFKDDNLAGESIWNIYKNRKMEVFSNFKLNFPRPGVAKHDMFGIRIAVIILTIVAFFMGGGEFGPQFLRAMSPPLLKTSDQKVKVDISVRSPIHVNKPPLLLSFDGIKGGVEEQDSSQTKADKNELINKRANQILLDSTAVIHVYGLRTKPELILGNRVAKFSNIAGKKATPIFRLETQLTGRDASVSEMALFHEDELLASWPIELIPDSSPEVELVGPPVRLEGGYFNLEIHLKIMHKNLLS